MRKSILKIGKKFILVIFIVLFAAFFWGKLASNVSHEGLKQEQEVEKAKIFREFYPIISESDLYCSFFILDEERLDIEIIGAEREYERIQLNNDDIFYINKGSSDGLEVGQIFQILEIGPSVKNPETGENFGPLALGRGRARILALEETRASAKVEKACGQISLGHFLIPFEEKEGYLGKNLGYNVPPHEAEGLKGMIIYVVREYNQIGPGHWAIVDLGEEDGLQVGHQMVIYKKLKEDVPLHIIGNLVVIDTQKRTSTVKILSSRDAVQIGELVQLHTQ